MPPKRAADLAAASESSTKKPRLAASSSSKKIVRKPAICDKCQKTLSSVSSLNHHIRTVHEGASVACTFPNCNKTYSAQQDLNRHIQVSHQGLSYSCEVEGCGRAYTSFENLKLHVQRDHGKIIASLREWKSRHACTFDGCFKTYTSQDDLNHHVQRDHDETAASLEEPRRDPDKTAASLKEPKPKPRHACPIEGCPKTYSGRSDLNRHIKTIHEDPGASLEKSDSSHLCLVEGCGKSYTSTSNLNHHVKTVHEGVKKPCPGCEKTFSSPSGLRNHFAHVHCGAEFRCPSCDKKFTIQTSLTSHFKSQHGTPEETAELRDRKLEIRQFLAYKETQGLCSATQSCPLPALKKSFCCQKHEEAVNVIGRTLKIEKENVTPQPDSIKSADEFALLLQRPKIYLDRKNKANLSLLARGLDDVHGSSKSFAMDAEWILARGGHTVPLDITIMRLNGEVIVSTRVDYSMTIKDLRAACKKSMSPICYSTIRKVYGETDTTWGKTPEQIIDILQNARIFSPDARI